MTTNNADFKVKKGLKVEGGNIDFSNAQHATIDMDATTTTNGTGKNITIKAGLGDGTGTGGLVVLKSGGNATGSGNGATSHVQALTIREGGDVHIGTNGLNATVTSTGSSINSTVIGDHSPASGKFTTLQTTGTYRADATVVTGSTVSINNADTASPSLNSNSDTQINGTFKSGGTNNSSLMTSELRLKSDISNDDLGGSWNDYQGDANLLVMENAENQPAGGQGVVFSVGASGTGSAWATGRLRGGTQTDDIFTIGYRGANWDAVGYKNGTNETTASPLQLAQSRFTINTDGNVGIHTLGGKLIFRGHASGDTTTVYEQSFNASTASTAAVSYVLPTGAPGGNGYVLSSTTGGQLSWIAAAGGADGMGAGFQLEDDDGTELAITTSKEIKFIGAGITTNWTDTDNGTDADPYDMTFTLDVDDLGTSANFAAGDLIAFGDSSTAGNDTVKGTVNTLATLFAGAGLTATSAVIAVDADQSGQITAVGTLTGLTVSGAADLNNNLTVDGATISLDATTSLNIDNSNTTNGITIGTATSGVPISIGHTTSEVTINDNLTVTGDLTVNGTQTFINSTTIELDDKNIELAKGLGNDVAVDGGGVTLKSTEGDKTFNYVNTNTAWTSSENFDIVSGKKYKLGGADIFTNATTLASGVVTSSLTQVGDLANGSIVSGFGTITTTAAITGGSLIADNITIDGNSITSTNINGDITLSPNGTGEVNIAAGNLNYAGTAVTATGAELNVLDGVTAGTVSASLALVVDANKDLATIRNLTSNGTVQAAAVSVDAVAVLDTSRGSGTDVSGATVLASYAAATYKTAKYIYQIKKDTADDTDVGEILVTYEGTSNDVYILEYGMISTGASIGAWSVNYNAGTVELKYTPTTDGNHTYTILNTLLI